MADQETHLRETFVEMLFALAVGQIAINAADLVELESSWQSKLPAWAHLAVGLIVIAASWLGWKRSASWRRTKPLEHLFSLAFIGLLLDVILVVLYFIIVRRAEIFEVASVPKLGPPSAKPESWWIIWMFAVYVGWDLLTDVFSEGNIPPDTKHPRRFRVAFVSSFASLVCVGLTYLVFVIASQNADPDAVVLLDVALICLALLFRLLKSAEGPLSKWFGVEQYPPFIPARPLRKHEKGWAVVLSITYVVCLLAASRLFS